MSSFKTPPTHFLFQRRPNLFEEPSSIDVSTVAAADYDVDVRSGFMPPAEPVARLTDEFSVWEDTLSAAFGHLQLAVDLVRASEEVKNYVDEWRNRVKQMPVVQPDSLFRDERQLRRAHLVLTYLMHFYIHSAKHDPSLPISIPSSISVPLVAVSRELGLPPILTYADTVLWNWKLNNPPPIAALTSPDRRTSLSTSTKPSTDISTRTSFTGTPDEAHFYMTSAWIELRGVEALTLMRRTLDETFVSDALAARRVASFLIRLAKVIEDITKLIDDVRTDCDPATFYHKIRPWYYGASAHDGGLGWKFEGVELSEEEHESWGVLSGPSAGQSSLVHALDVFLGVDHTKPSGTSSSHGHGYPNASSSASSSSQPPLTSKLAAQLRPPPQSQSRPSKSPDATFLQRMQQYMPRHHRAFLRYLGTVENPVRNFVLKSAEAYVPLQRASFADEDENTDKNEAMEEPPLTKAYNTAVDALKRFRDSHIRVVTIYILSASRRDPPRLGEAGERKPEEISEEERIKRRRDGATGTGGTQLVPFLKGARDNTRKTALR